MLTHDEALHQTPIKGFIFFLKHTRVTLYLRSSHEVTYDSQSL